MTQRTPAVVYRRVSSAQQGRGNDRNDGGWSLQSQEARASEYIAAHNLKLARAPFEEVASAAKQGRPVFAALVKYLAAHPGTHLIVEKMDRLARNSRDAATVDELIDAGVVIHLVRDAKMLHAGSSPGERLSSDIEGAVAKHYSRNLGLEVRKGLDARFAAGLFVMGTPPYGYRYPDKIDRSALAEQRRARRQKQPSAGGRINIEPDPKAAPVVKKLFTLYARGETSFAEIVELAHQLGYRHRSGGRMSTASAQKLLKNPTYAGWVRHNGELAKGSHEPIVSQALFDQVQRAMESRPRCGHPNRPRAKMSHAFSGVFKCEHCSGPVSRHQRDAGSTVYWYCRTSCSSAKYMRDEDITEQVVEHLQTLALPRARVDAIVCALHKHAAAKPDASITEGIAREQAKRERLLDLFQDGDITKAVFKERKAASERKEAALREELEQLGNRAEALASVDAVAQRLDLCRDFAVLWANGTPEEQRKILGLVWETSGAAKSALDATAKRISPNWRPTWRALLDAGAYAHAG